MIDASADHADCISTPSTVVAWRARNETLFPVAASGDGIHARVVPAATRVVSGDQLMPSSRCSTSTTFPAVSPLTVTVGGDDAADAVMVGVAGGVHETVNAVDERVRYTPPVCQTRTHALRLAPLVHAVDDGAVSGDTALGRTPEVHSGETVGSVSAAAQIHTW